MNKRTYCATCAYFRDQNALELGYCERHRHVVFGGTPACDDAIKPEATSGIGKTIIVTLRKWFGKPTRDNLSRVGRVNDRLLIAYRSLTDRIKENKSTEL